MAIDTEVATQGVWRRDGLWLAFLSIRPASLPGLLPSWWPTIISAAATSDGPDSNRPNAGATRFDGSH